MVNPLWRYYVRGFQGLVQMMEELHRDSPEMDPTTKANAAHWIGRLIAVFNEKPASENAAPPSSLKRQRRHGAPDGK